ncbi:MAG: glycoside hydrolase family 3 protein [Ignavibacteriae bacterium]|nr:glycoside hydrolase family 3 protein [Ignavibacteriota bacterium]
MGKRRCNSFPQSIGLAATWNTNLMSEVANAIAKEVKSRGLKQILSPVINIARDVRWGRTEETYGEDPFLTSKMGLAYISKFENRHYYNSETFCSKCRGWRQRQLSYSF